MDFKTNRVMRTIKFRGKATHTNKWICGDLLKIGNSYHIVEKDDMREDGHHITQDSDIPTWVDEKTIGQYTGLFDKNGKEIYEGDIITCINKSDSVYEIGRQMIGFVAYEENGCYWFCKNNFQHYNDWAFADDIEVIGNIHDNKELLKGE